MNTDDIPEETRALLDGEGADPPTFVEWVNEMSPVERREVFGETKARQWEAGEHNQRVMLDQRARPL